MALALNKKRIVWPLAIFLIGALGTVSPFSVHLVARRNARDSVTLSSSVDCSPKALHSDNSEALLLIVDVDNVRGKSRFQWTHEGLIASATTLVWRNTTTTASTTTLYKLAFCVDHGSMASLHTGGPLEDGVGVLFSGTSCKADDVIVSLVRDSRVATKVVTADRELKRLCRQQHASTRSSIILDFVEPLSFLGEIESHMEHGQQHALQLDGRLDDAEDEEGEGASIANGVHQEVAIRQQLQIMDRLLHPKRQCNGKKAQLSRKQRTKLVRKRDLAQEKLEELISKDEFMTLSSVLEQKFPSSTLDTVVRTVSKSRMSFSSVETTYERQLLAERLRRRLVRAGTFSTPVENYNENTTPLHDTIMSAKRSDKFAVRNGKSQEKSVHPSNRDGQSLSSSVLTVPRRFHRKTELDASEDIPSTLLRVVVVSDTHGYEHELFAHSSGGEKPHLLPPADVLIHCGDFSGCGSRKIKLQSKACLDAFLAAQTHIPTKIVLRGNHDPHTPGRVLFPRSQALYVTKPMTITLPYNVMLGLRPFSRRGDILLLPPCDILATHEPPFGILDLTYQQMRAGSMSLRRAVEASPNKPSLWLCGHIHEGRGSVMHTFVAEHIESSAESTLVINAANANAGKANRIVTGPVLVDVVKDVSLVTNTSAWTAGASADSRPATLDRPDSLEVMVSIQSRASIQSEVSVDSRRLLSVDVGLSTATVVLDGSGRILQVDDWRFTDLHQLEGALDGLLRNHSITHVVVEGADSKLVRIWRGVVEKNDLYFARVVAEDWREAFLLPKERKTKQAAKDAAVLIAKQFWDSKKVDGCGKTSTKLSKDAAEAILVGLYAVRALGWNCAESFTAKRYSNGNIVRSK